MSEISTQEMEVHRELCEAIGITREASDKDLTRSLNINFRQALAANFSLNDLLADKVFNYEASLTNEVASKIFQEFTSIPKFLSNFGCLLASDKFMAKLPEASIRVIMGRFISEKKFKHLEALFSSNILVTDRIIKNFLEERGVEEATVSRILSIQSVREKIQGYLKKVNIDTFHYLCKLANPAVAEELYKMVPKEIEGLIAQKMTTVSELHKELTSENGAYIKLLMKFSPVQDLMAKYKKELNEKDIDSTYLSLNSLNGQAIKELFRNDDNQSILDKLSTRLSPQYLRSKSEQVENTITHVNDEILNILYAKNLIKELFELYLNKGEGVHKKLLFLIENDKKVLFKLVINQEDIVKKDSNPAELIERIAEKKEYEILKILFEASRYLSGRSFDEGTPQYRNYEEKIARIYQNAAKNGLIKILNILNEHAYPYIKNKGWTDTLLPPEPDIYVACKTLDSIRKEKEKADTDSVTPTKYDIHVIADNNKRKETKNKPGKQVYDKQAPEANSDIDNNKQKIYKPTGIDYFTVADTVYHIIAGTVHCVRGYNALMHTIKEFRQLYQKEVIEYKPVPDTEAEQTTQPTSQPVSSVQTNEPASSVPTTQSTSQPASSTSTTQLASQSASSVPTTQSTSQPASSTSTTQLASQSASSTSTTQLASQSASSTSTTQPTPQPASSTQTKQPASSTQTKQPTSSTQTKQPASSTQTKQPSNAYKQPASSAYKPASSAYNQPASSTHKKPASSTQIKQKTEHSSTQIKQKTEYSSTQIKQKTEYSSTQIKQKTEHSTSSTHTKPTSSTQTKQLAAKQASDKAVLPEEHKAPSPLKITGFLTTDEKVRKNEQIEEYKASVNSRIETLVKDKDKVIETLVKDKDKVIETLVKDKDKVIETLEENMKRTTEAFLDSSAKTAQKFFAGTEFGMAVTHFFIAGANIVKADYSFISSALSISTMLISCGSIFLLENDHLKHKAKLVCAYSASIASFEIGYDLYGRNVLHNPNEIEDVLHNPNETEDDVLHKYHDMGDKPEL